MRILAALRSDIRFQVKQGFYVIYFVLTITYMLTMRQLPNNIKVISIPLVVFSDPSVVGFFFIGGIVMLEKVQGILNYIVVTPLRTREYLLSKVISLAILGEAAGIAIVLQTYQGKVNWLLLITGIFLSSVFFTLFGFLIAAGCRTINQYFIKAVPYTLILILPCFSIIGFKYSWAFDLFPSAAGLKLVLWAFSTPTMVEALVCFILLAFADLLLLFYVEKIFNKEIVCGGEL